MGDAIKWGLLIAGLVVIIGLIVALPFFDFVDADNFADTITSITSIAGGALFNARCLINNFFSPLGRTILSGILIWLFGKWALKISLNIIVWVYHFIFK